MDKSKFIEVNGKKNAPQGSYTIGHLISILENAKLSNEPYLRTIRNVSSLIACLKRYEKIIGNDEAKDAIAEQITHLICTKPDGKMNDESKLNMIFYGPPGAGKTMMAEMTAEILYHLGYIQDSNKKKSRISSLAKEVSDSGSSMFDSIFMIYLVVFLLVLFCILVLSFATKSIELIGKNWTMILIGILIVSLALSAYLLFSDDSKLEKMLLSDVSPKKTERDLSSSSNIYTLVSRADFVGQYVGWSAKKTIDLLNANLGKVLIVDEAYTLINSPMDDFGKEALDALNLFLSQHPNEIIVIFCGYRDLLEAGPFASQPGLVRRFMWQFHCNGYNTKELFQIFKMMLAKVDWSLSSEEEVKKIFDDNANAFPNYGGDCEKLVFFSQLSHSRERMQNSKVPKNVLNSHHVFQGMNRLKENNIQKADSSKSKESERSSMSNLMKLLSGQTAVKSS
jgi:DNA polymerase III delta prime subunit